MFSRPLALLATISIVTACGGKTEDSSSTDTSVEETAVSDTSGDETDTDTDTDTDTNSGEEGHQSWRIVNAQDIGDHWNISELSLFKDRNCTVSLKGNVTHTFAASTDACVQTGPAIMADGSCSFNSDCASDVWANDSTGSSLAGEVWISQRLDAPAEVRCIRICQADEASQRATEIVVQSSDDGQNWTDEGTLTATESATGAPTVFVLQ